MPLDLMKDSRLPIAFLLFAKDKQGRQAAPIHGSLRIQKLIFLLKKEYKVSRRSFISLEFKAHKFGMFSQKIQDDLSFMLNMGLIEKIDSKGRSIRRGELNFETIVGEDPGDGYAYQLTDRGKEFVKKIIERTRTTPDSTEKMDQIMKACDELKTRFNHIPVDDLLRYVYEKYPEFAVKSQIADRIMGRK